MSFFQQLQATFYKQTDQFRYWFFSYIGVIEQGLEYSRFFTFFASDSNDAKVLVPGHVFYANQVTDGERSTGNKS